MKKTSAFLGKALLITSLNILLFAGCAAEDPASPKDGGTEPVATQRAENAGATGVSIYSNIASFQQVESFIVDQNEIGQLDIPNFDTPGGAAKMARITKGRSLRALSKRPDVLNRMASAAGDSIIFDITERDSIEGVTRRISLIYDPEAGTARFFVVGFEYRSESPVEYDSTEIKGDLAGTLLDDSDDVLLSLSFLKRYKAGQLIREERASFLPDTHAPGTDPEGGVLTNDITYGNTSFISSTSARFEFHESTGGSYSKTSNFSDNSSHRESATFDLQGNGTFEEDLRDGTKISGTFNGAEDGQGGYSKTTTFPSGHDPVKVSESGEFTFNATDSTLSGSFEREITPLTGDVMNEKVELSQTRVGDVLSTTLNIQNTDGSHGFITVTETDDVDQASGEWTNADETFVVFNAQSYSDDSAHLEFQVYASEVAFENNEAPILTAVFDFYPDGSGRGVVTEGEDVYDVVIHPDGSVTVTKRS